MSNKTSDKFNDFMSRGWSWPQPCSCDSSDIPQGDSKSVSIIDKATGVKYLLEVVNGTLTMTEVTK